MIRAAALGGEEAGSDELTSTRLARPLPELNGREGAVVIVGVAAGALCGGGGRMDRTGDVTLGVLRWGERASTFFAGLSHTLVAGFVWAILGSRAAVGLERGFGDDELTGMPPPSSCST